MRINLRCRNIRMSQKFLNDSQIGAVFKNMGCKRMPQSMRRDVLGDSCLLDLVFEVFPYSLSCQTFAMKIDEQEWTALVFAKLGSGIVEVVVNPDDCLVSNRNDSFFSSFSHGLNYADIKVQILKFEVDAYISSRIARLRIPKVCDVSGALSSISTSSVDRTSGKCFSPFGVSIEIIGSS